MLENYCFKIIHCPQAKHVNVMHLVKILLEKQLIPLMFWVMILKFLLKIIMQNISDIGATT
jgi:hypothetical protein